MHAGIHPNPVNRITDRCKNITFPQLRLRAVIIVMSFWIANKTFQDKAFQLEAYCPLANRCIGRGAGYGVASEQVEQVGGAGHGIMGCGHMRIHPLCEQTDRHD